MERADRPQLSRTLTKAEETHQVTEDAIRRAALPGTGLGAMRLCADGHNDANRQSTVRLRLMLLGQSTGMWSDTAVQPMV
jgi:hypothetical protein